MPVLHGFLPGRDIVGRWASKLGSHQQYIGETYKNQVLNVVALVTVPVMLYNSWLKL